MSFLLRGTQDMLFKRAASSTTYQSDLAVPRFAHRRVETREHASGADVTGIGFHVRPIRMVVFIELDNSVGGGFQQATNAALLAKRLPPELCNVTFITTRRSAIEELHRNGIDARYLRVHRWQKLLARFHVMWRLLNPPQLFRKHVYFNWLDRSLREMGADLVYFTGPSYLALVTAQFSYLFTVWDLAHRDEVDFPEVRCGGEFERREQIYQLALKKATGVVVDSEAGRDNVIRRYAVDEERVHVIPFSPAIGTQLREHELDHPDRFIDIKAKYGLDCDYVYYPAQFWPHKNHVYLLRGLRSLEDRFGIRVGAIFSGRDFGNLAHVRSVADELRLADRIRFAGFVSDIEVTCLYRQAVALVMPTYFGPTNLPPYEAFQLRVPVLYSDLKNLRDQIDDAGLLIDLVNPDSMADALRELIIDPDLRMRLIQRGKHRIESLTDDRRLSVLRHALETFRVRRMCWQPSPKMSRIGDS
ncbi:MULTISPECIES: glycosyltransferase family 1 protein [unclassified Caballeronia]|uniref:glycosyltransferase family 4 protein n=1 Tax=unclassified Caballeronia TaxID=2646786 RepID=UPI002028E9BF|nr:MULTISPECIES: glycosyltransferase family 1 protein [unclassified Caballeronia]MDR5766935.1 glycosyltransferase family 1 protein [Caballeronia sp. LZ028]